MGWLVSKRLRGREREKEGGSNGTACVEEIVIFGAPLLYIVREEITVETKVRGGEEEERRGEGRGREGVLKGEREMERERN